MEKKFTEQIKKIIAKKQGGKFNLGRASAAMGIPRTTLYEFLEWGTNPKLYTTIKKIMLYTGCSIRCHGNEIECIESGDKNDNSRRVN